MFLFGETGGASWDPRLLTKCPYGVFHGDPVAVPMTRATGTAVAPAGTAALGVGSEELSCIGLAEISVTESVFFFA